MNLSKEIKEVIEKNLPAQTAGALNGYLKKAKEAIEINEYLRGKETELAKEKDVLREKATSLESLISTKEEIKDKLKDIETRELALEKTILEIKLQESEKRASVIITLTETVFKNRKLVIEKSSNVPLAVEGSSGCMGGVVNDMGNETETREEQ